MNKIYDKYVSIMQNMYGSGFRLRSIDDPIYIKKKRTDIRNQLENALIKNSHDNYGSIDCANLIFEFFGDIREPHILAKIFTYEVILNRNVFSDKNKNVRFGPGISLINWKNIPVHMYETEYIRPSIAYQRTDNCDTRLCGYNKNGEIIYQQALQWSFFSPINEAPYNKLTDEMYSYWHKKQMTSYWCRQRRPR